MYQCKIKSYTQQLGLLCVGDAAAWFSSHAWIESEGATAFQALIQSQQLLLLYDTTMESVAAVSRVL